MQHITRFDELLTEQAAAHEAVNDLNQSMTDAEVAAIFSRMHAADDAVAAEMSRLEAWRSRNPWSSYEAALKTTERGAAYYSALASLEVAA